MTLTFKKNYATLLHFLFIIWFASALLFQYSIISRLALLLFVGCSILITRGKFWSCSLTAYLLFALWSVANIAFGHAVSVSVASKMTQTLFLNLLFLYAFVCYCRYVNSVESVLNVYKWVVAAFCVPCLLGGLGSVLSGSRLSILGINANVIASMAAYASIIAFNDVLISKSRKERRAGMWLVLFLLVTILMTGSRKGLIIPFVGIYLLICSRKPKKFVIYTLAVAIIAISALYLLLNVRFLYDIVGYRVEPVLQYISGEEFSEASLSSRSDYILLGWLSSQDSLIWGHGLDCFRTLRYAYGTYSHNNYIEILYSLGWIGICIYYSSHVRAILNMFKSWRCNSKITALVAGLLVSFLVCEYMNVTYFERPYLLIPVISILYVEKRGKACDNQKIN